MLIVTVMDPKKKSSVEMGSSVMYSVFYYGKGYCRAKIFFGGKLRNPYFAILSIFKGKFLLLKKRLTLSGTGSKIGLNKN